MAYYIIYSLLWLISLIPLRILYLLSDLIYLFLSHGIGYRRKVIMENLRNAFPEKTEKELEQITKKFYRHFADFLVETIKMINMSRKEVDKRFVCKNVEIFSDLYAKKKNIVVVSGHYGNWEWMSHISLYVNQKFLVAYQRLMNETSDRIMLKLRTKYGKTDLVQMQDIYRCMLEHAQKKITVAVWLLIDQRPPKEYKYWTTFLHQDTAFYNSAEKMARKFDMAVVFLDIQKRKRGHYEIHFTKLFEDPREAKENEITETYIRFLEQRIQAVPEYWLWSHKRWKHKKPLQEVQS